MDCIEAPPARSGARHRSLFFGIVLLLVIWVTERLFIALWGEQQPTFFGWLPVRWLCDAAELGVLGTCVFWGIWDANEDGTVMKNPSHPGSLIKADIDELGLSVVAAAKALGISRQQLHSVIAGRAGVTPEMAVRLEKALGSTADTWLRMQMNYDLALVATLCQKASL